MPAEFRARFGADALRIVSKRAPTRRNLRGIHLEVVEDGHVSVGDEIRVLRDKASKETDPKDSSASPR